MTIFVVLNGAAFVFLLYALVKFWQEGHRPKQDSRPPARSAVAVIPFPVRDPRMSDPLHGQAISSRHRERPTIRISTR